MNRTLAGSNKTTCRLDIPFANEVLNDDLPLWTKCLLVFFGFCCIVSVVVFVEEIIFLVTNFRKGNRLNRTIWILATFPMFTLTSFLALLVPRSGTLINLVANTFFASVIYQLVELIVDYLGGRNKMWIIIGESRSISIRTPPLCCCCLCLPNITLTRKTFEKFYNLVMQVTIVRPLLMFIAAVLWTDDMYIPGYLLPNNAFLYVATGNLLSTLLAIWGLVILKTGFRSELDKQYQMTGKIFSIQLTLISTSVANIICGILVTTNVIGCTGLLSSKARADALFHMVLVVLMSFLGLIARSFFRRKTDGADNVCFEETLNIATNIDCNAAEAEMHGREGDERGDGRGDGDGEGRGNGGRRGSGGGGADPNSSRDIIRIVKDSREGGVEGGGAGGGGAGGGGGQINEAAINENKSTSDV